MQTYGYARVSSTYQNELRQLLALRARNIPEENIFIDKQSGRDFIRPQYVELVLQILSFVAQNEREFIHKRQAEGIAAAKAKGVKFGRPPIPLPDNFYPVHKAWRAKKMTLKQAAATCGMPVGTFYSKAVRFENTT